MKEPIPEVVDELYWLFVPSQRPEYWPEYIAHDPTKAHGMYSFYQGLLLGLHLADACREE